MRWLRSMCKVTKKDENRMTIVNISKIGISGMVVHGEKT